MRDSRQIVRDRPWLVWSDADAAHTGKHGCASCVMTFFNQAAYFPAALDSVLGNFPPGAVVVVDDCSAEDECAAAHAYCASRHVRYVRLTMNVGPAGARMAGTRLVDADFLMFMDSDDVLAPDYLRQLLGALDRDTDAGFALGVQRFFETDFLDLGKSWPVGGKSIGEILDEPCLSASGVLFRRTVFDQSGGFRARMRGGFEDWDLGIRLAAMGLHGVVCPAANYHYRRCGDSQMASIDAVKRAAIDCVLWVNNRDFVRALSGDLAFLERFWWPSVAEALRRWEIRRLAALMREAFSRGGVRFLASLPLQSFMFCRWMLRRRLVA